VALRRVAIVFVVLAGLVRVAAAQIKPPSESLLITARSAYTWMDGRTNVVQLEGFVTLRTDDSEMMAQRAVVWLTPSSDAVLDQLDAEIALLGEVKVVTGDVEREAQRLLVRTRVRGAIRITADERLARNQSDSDLFREASDLRTGRLQAPSPDEQPPAEPAPRRPEEGITPQPDEPPHTPPQRTPAEQPMPADRPAPAPRPPAALHPGEPVNFRAGDVQTVQSPDDRVALILSNGVVIFQRRQNGDFIELQSDSAVLYTQLRNLRELQESDRFKQIEDAIESAYLEGDVRITYTPALATRPEQRLRASRIYYEFGTDRAILTDAVLHTVEPQRQIPVIVRANTLRQLTLGEYRAEGVELSTSSFKTPSYSINAQKAYVRSQDTGDPRYGNRTTFAGENITFNTFGLPVFYLPAAAGSVTDRGGALRDVQFRNNDRFGFGVQTEWGLFESFGRLPPQDLDASYRLDYYTDRGFATGLDAYYSGGFITETTRQPWNFNGAFRSYFIFDHGTDTFGGSRTDVDTDRDVRGRVLWTHQHFFPDDWQVQLRAAWVSDPTVMEQWFRRDWAENEEHDLSAYFKRQRGSEAITFLLDYQPNDFVTTSDLIQEQFEIEKLPDIGYRRIGDSLASDRLTLFSENTVAALRFKASDASLLEQGYPSGLSPGLPSLGQTGVQEKTVYRGDFRQQINFPFSTGQFRFLPYVIGRYTPYSDSPEDGAVHRIYMGAGLRVTTAFWAVDDTFESRWFDIHRLRHVIEPEVHLFTGAQNEDRNDVFIYEEDVDNIHDVSAVQFALRQRWQTKRGGPGRWRSVDFFTLDLEANFFTNKPDDELPPKNFRGLFFASRPEASIPRDSLNAEATWRVADTTAILADLQYNLSEGEIATGSVGLAVQRDANLSYFIGTRYIEELKSNITTAAVVYRISPKYTISLSQSFDFGKTENVGSSAQIVRRFDRFFVSLTGYYDNTSDVGGFNISIQPEGLSRGFDTGAVRTFFPTDQR
jgi:hypothetical protein